MRIRNAFASAVALACFSKCCASAAAAILLSGQLVGDPRSGNPDFLAVDWSVEVLGSSPTIALFEFDLSPMSTAHLDAKLDLIAGMLSLENDELSALSTFGVSTPPGWSFGKSDKLQGSGNARFTFSEDSPNPSNVRLPNSPTLSFSLSLGPFSWTEEMFSSAPFSSSSDSDLNLFENPLPPPGYGFQLGAHLQSLVQGPGNTTDSGVAVGLYGSASSDSSSGIHSQNPEPSTFITFAGLLGMGLIGSCWRRRRKAAN
jgi:hypothetical protein